MTNRLIYDTLAGNLDAKGTFAQLREYLAKAEDGAKEMARHCKLKHDTVKADAWLVVADNFRRCTNLVSHLGNTRTKSGVGYGPSN